MLHDGFSESVRKLVAVVIDTALRLLKEELSVVVVGLYAVVVAPLEVSRTMVTAQCELAPSYLAVLLELNEFFDCMTLTLERLLGTDFLAHLLDFRVEIASGQLLLGCRL